MIRPDGLVLQEMFGYIWPMNLADQPTRIRLITTAAEMFRRQGYHATGLAELLAAAQVPKGSLYHHFPAGKADLALAAADWIAGQFMRIVDDAFTPAIDFTGGATTLCFKLAKLFDQLDAQNICPMTAVLFEGPPDESFRANADVTFQRLTGHLASHGKRLGLDRLAAQDKAELLVVAIQGAWTIARAQRRSDLLRNLPARLFP
jgi:TetR/AcrR family transcriptional regulator, lmrAB and yxaGH operons repressor